MKGLIKQNRNPTLCQRQEWGLFTRATDLTNHHLKTTQHPHERHLISDDRQL